MEKRQKVCKKRNYLGLDNRVQFKGKNCQNGIQIDPNLLEKKSGISFEN